MSDKKILVQINSAFDLYICTAIIKDHRNQRKADLLIPNGLLERAPESILDCYDLVIGFDPRIRNLLSIKSIKESARLGAILEEKKDLYQTVLFGAYRNDMASLVTKYLQNSNFFAVKQGVDIPDSHYVRYRSLSGIHDRIYYSFFGYSSFRRERLIQKTSSSKKSDYLFMRPVWEKDPFDRKENVFTIGKEVEGYNDGTPYLLPNFGLMKGNKDKPRSGVLIIGERTPMTPTWGGEQSAYLQRIYEIIQNKFPDEKIFVRARKNLTNSYFYSSLNPVFLDPDQLYDDQLIKLNPRLVISVKSTASKVASYYGFNSILLYPSLNFKDSERFHLDYLFADGAPFRSLTSVDDFEDMLEEEADKDYFDHDHSSKTLDSFYEKFKV